MSKPIKYFQHVTPECWEIIDSALQMAYKRAGNPSRLARTLGVERNLLTLWKQHKRLPTPQQAYYIEALVRVSRKSIRPDIDWNYVNAEGFPPMERYVKTEVTRTQCPV